MVGMALFVVKSSRKGWDGSAPRLCADKALEARRKIQVEVGVEGIGFVKSAGVDGEDAQSLEKLYQLLVRRERWWLSGVEECGRGKSDGGEGSIMEDRERWAAGRTGHFAGAVA